jgi:hypothetical protein
MRPICEQSPNRKQMLRPLGGLPESKGFGTGHAPLLDATHSLRAETGSGDPIQVPGKGVSRSKRRGRPRCRRVPLCRESQQRCEAVEIDHFIGGRSRAIHRGANQRLRNPHSTPTKGSQKPRVEAGQSATSALSKTHWPASAAADNARCRDYLRQCAEIERGTRKRVTWSPIALRCIPRFRKIRSKYKRRAEIKRLRDSVYRRIRARQRQEATNGNRVLYGMGRQRTTPDTPGRFSRD